MIEKFIETGAIYNFDSGVNYDTGDTIDRSDFDGQVIEISENWVLTYHAYQDYNKTQIFRVNKKVKRLINLNKCFAIKRFNPEQILEHGQRETT